MLPLGAGAVAEDAIVLSSSSSSDVGGEGMVVEEEVGAGSPLHPSRLDDSKNKNDDDDDDKGLKKKMKSGESGEEGMKRKKKKDEAGEPVPVPVPVIKGEEKEEKKDNKPKKMGSNAASSSSSSSPATVGATTGSTSCTFPMSRVWRLVRNELELGKITVRTTPDAIFLINKASEMFLKLFAEDAFGNAATDHKKHITYEHLSSIVHDAKRYEFLSDFIPEKVRAEDALKARASVEA